MRRSGLRSFLADFVIAAILSSFFINTLFIPVAKAADPWWDSSYLKRIKITFDTTTTATTTNLTNFPVGVLLNSSRISYADTGAGGKDIRFVDADGSTLLNYEIDTWNTSGTSTIWVKVPQVNSNSSADYIWMYYNNAAVSDSSTTTGVWTNGYLGVWHLNENPAGTAPQMKNSVSASWNGTSGGTMTSGDSVSAQFGNGLDFDGSNDYIDMGNLTSASGELTLSGWAYNQSTTTKYLFGKDGSNQRSFILMSGDDGSGVTWGSDFGIASASNTTVFAGGGVSGLALSAWYYLQGKWKASTEVTEFVDGTKVTTTSTAPAALLSSTNNFYLARRNAGTTVYWLGRQDEVRFSNIARSDDWMRFENCTMHDSCMTYAAAETYAPNVAPSVSITAPANGATSTAGSDIPITATASDTDGTVSKVEFYQGTTKLGEDASSPYAYTWAAVPAGTYSLTAVATDDAGARTTSTAISVTADTPPAVSITAPAEGATSTEGDPVAISANASDTDGTVSKVEFYQGTTKLGEDASSPYSYSWNAPSAGTYSLTAVATDDLGARTTSTAVSITVNPSLVNTAPTVSLTYPANGTILAAGSSLTISAISSDADGTVSKVEFYQGTTKLGEDASSPYSYVWSSVPAGTYSLTAVATDNDAARTTSTAVSITASSQGRRRIVTSPSPVPVLAVSPIPSSSSAEISASPIPSISPFETPTSTPEASVSPSPEPIATSTSYEEPETRTKLQVLIQAIQYVLLKIIQQRSLALPDSQNIPSVNGFLQDLPVGSVHPDVLRLQKFLNGHGILVATSGPGSPGHETNIFGEKTERALEHYQQEHDILPLEGYFGPRTRAKMNEQLKGGE